MVMTDLHFPILEPQGTLLDLSVGDRYAILMNAFKHQYFAWARQIAKRYGWQVSNEIAQAVADESVPFIAPGFKRKFGLKGEGSELVGQVMRVQFMADGSEPTVTRESPDHVEFKVLCMWGGALQSGRFPTEIVEGLCHEGCVGWGQRVAHTVDPQIKVERLTWMGAGATRCHFRVTRPRSGDASGPLGQESAPERGST
jgi:hypothetical protein